MEPDTTDMINGILNIYKEKGYTSHDVVARLRGITKQKKIGHTGTLDPDAEGVLPVCLGRATKVCDLLTDKDKVYETILLLGKVTDTQDISGKVLEEKETKNLTETQVQTCIQGYIGTYEQLPPMYSALKVNGKKLYELARAGIEVERKKRKITIHEIQILGMELPRVRMRVHCSKGTYIRTLCHDIGAELGVGGCMESLLRTKVSCFERKDSLKLDQIEHYVQEGRLDEILLSVDRLFEEARAVFVKSKYESLVLNGNPFGAKALKGKDTFADQEQVRVYDTEERFVGIFEYRAEKQEFRVKKMFLVE